MKQKIEDYLGQIVYGAIDGSVTTFAVVAGAAGAGLDSTVVIVLGFANLIADGFSMGASSYLSAKSERDLKLSRNADHDGGETPLGDGIATFAAFVVVGFVPILVYVADALLRTKGHGDALFAASCFLTGATFMAIGVIKGKVTKTSQLRAAIETFLLGTIAALLAYGLGDMLGNALTSR